MYISYGLSVGIVMVVGPLLYYLAGDPPVWLYITGVALTVVLLTPLLFRYARLCYTGSAVLTTTRLRCRRALRNRKCRQMAAFLIPASSYLPGPLVWLVLV